ncbi:hypothetical protein GGR58DRAFT_286573 [Xylaria digitata]|nr:hypothetical protein GGR58DRAFT_286573 [Xylaria digitata]
MEGVGMFRSREEMDRFFYTDEKYKEYTHNTPPAMLGSMHRALRFSKRGAVPGGHIRALSAEGSTLIVHRLIYDTECIPVDEESWFPFLKRSRWWDTVWFDPDPLIYGVWSVDNSKIWEHLKMALEVANRIFRALLKDKHPYLHTALFGQITRWTDQEYQPTPCPEPFPNATVLLSYAYRQRRWAQCHGDVPYPLPSFAELTEADWTKRLEYLLEEQQLGFGPSEDVDADDFYGLHISQHKQILFNVDGLRKLISKDLTLAERCVRTVQLATVVRIIYTALDFLPSLMTSLR